MKDFFISYTSSDKAWAEWIGFVLEEADFGVIIQEWDFRPGSNFVLEMQRAAIGAERTIMVLSPDYLTSQFASSEWAAAFVSDPQGLGRKLVPVVVRHCNPPGLLQPIVHINLLGADEAEANERLLNGISAKRGKPARRPAYPGSVTVVKHKMFPGAGKGAAPPAPAAYMPNMKHHATDVEKRHFLRQSFDIVSSYFQSGLALLVEHNTAVEKDFELGSTSDFTAEVFINGKLSCRCCVWRGGLHSENGISYSEGFSSSKGGSINEVLTLIDTGNGLHFSAILGAAFAQQARLFDLKSLSQEQAAEYLWRRFVAPLEK